MKVVRVPWIQCRADEVDTILLPMTWRGREFDIMAYSENEAREWWGSIGESERSGALGMGGSDEGMSLF